MKAYTKGAKKRAKKAMAGMPELAPAPRQKKRGKARMQELAVSDGGEKRTALSARLNCFGIGLKKETREDGQRDMAAARRNERALRAMDAEPMSDPAGRAIYLTHQGKDAEMLWQVYRGLVSAEERYSRVVTGAALHPKTAKMEYLPERFATSAEDEGPDLRSEDERHRDAVNSWMHWRGLVQHLTAARQTAIFDVVRGRTSPHQGGTITASGRAFLKALCALRDVVDARG